MAQANSLMAALERFGGPLSIVPSIADNSADSMLAASADINGLPNHGLSFVVPEVPRQLISSK